jgi:UDP-N-acetylglucosamine 2-epimerase (non-hydrolysing)
MQIEIPSTVRVVEPVGYEEMLALMVNARATITDSGTVVEEACVLQLPSVQMRRSTERPQVYDARSSVKFVPGDAGCTPERTFAALESLVGTSWVHGLGDGRTSERIATDLHRRVVEGGFERHRPEHYHLPIARSYRGDGL